MMEIKIALDVEDVIADPRPLFFKELNRKYNTRLTMEDIQACPAYAQTLIASRDGNSPQRVRSSHVSL